MNEKMTLNEGFYPKLKNLLNENQILIDEPLKNHTTFEVGGPASFLILPDNISQIEESVKLCKDENIPFYVIGNGSNLLVSDKGYTGVIIKICKNYSNVTIKKESESDVESNETKYIVEAESGVLLSDLSRKIADNELTGFEFAAGIPGTLGGAVTMNAGAYDGEIKDSIIGATVMDTEGNIYELGKEELKLGYRKSIIQDKHYIVLKASFMFEKGNLKDINDKIIDLNNRRADKQPLEYPSAGSTFKRPEGYYASKLIMDSDLRGFRYGNACVSEKHCGFVINQGGATAAEITTLIHQIIEIVSDKYGVILEPEVKLLGEF